MSLSNYTKHGTKPLAPTAMRIARAFYGLPARQLRRMSALSSLQELVPGKTPRANLRPGKGDHGGSIQDERSERKFY